MKAISKRSKKKTREKQELCRISWGFFFLDKTRLKHCRLAKRCKTKAQIKWKSKITFNASSTSRNVFSMHDYLDLCMVFIIVYLIFKDFAWFFPLTDHTFFIYLAEGFPDFVVIYHSIFSCYNEEGLKWMNGQSNKLNFCDVCMRYRVFKMSILENESLNTEYETLYDVGMFFFNFLW